VHASGPRTLKPGHLCVFLAALGAAAGCQSGDGSPPSVLAADTTPAVCSQMHRDLSRWQGSEISDCGPDVTGLIELTPIGNDLLLARKPFSPLDDLWQLAPGGGTLTGPTSVPPVAGAATAGFTLLPGSPPRVLVYDPRQSQWTLYATQGPIGPESVFATDGQSQWPPGAWPANENAGPWDQQFIGLENGYILDRNLGDGSTHVWSVVSGSSGTSPNQLVLSSNLVGGPTESFRRGHRLVHLGPNRLGEWLPRPCAGQTSPSDPCAGSDFNVWSYSLDSGATAFAPQIVSSGFWPDIGAESELVADGEHLFVWTRATGRLRTYALDPTLADPLSQPPVADLPPNAPLASQEWTPPTTAPAIKHLVLIVQDGRSFDSYFGRYCQAMPGDGPTCTVGPACCEAIPTTIAGTAGCVDPETETGYRPVDLPECLRAKMDDGAMDGFAVAHSPGPCGDPRDVACAGTGPGAGGVSIYQGLAAGGALADRFFQTYAFEDGATAASEPDPLIENLLYLIAARFTALPDSLMDTPLLTKELVRLQVSWAIYADPVALPQLTAFGVPIYYDPDWFPYRALAGGELEHDIGVGALPAVSVVLPDRGDAARSEAPGLPFDPGIDYVASLVSTIAASPYQSDTLVLVTYLTAGGFYDHVPPPPPPPLKVDASSDTLAQATAIHYGPRVPLLALGKFAQTNVISHVQLELSSITKFIEWNWLHGSALKGSRETDDPRRYRDTAVNNLGSLIAGDAAGAVVPAGPN
jgi:phospholipase C